MLRGLVAVGLLGMVSCAGPPEVLEVKQFHLRSTDVPRGEDDLVRGEKLKRLHGAVSMEERRDRLGQYFGVKWNGPAGLETEPVRLVFEFQQAATGSKVLRAEQTLPGTSRGEAEFRITGPAYLKGGRVLAWRLRMYRGGEEVAVKRSYLWD